MQLGARVFKTGIAIALALYIADVLGLPVPIFAGIAAIFAVQPSIYRSYMTVFEQIQSNLIGAAFAVTFAIIFGNSYFMVGLTTIIAISVMLKLKLQKAIPLALVTIIAIMEIQGDDFLMAAAFRILTIGVGVFSAFAVNLVFLPPKYETRLFTKISTTQDDIIRWIRIGIRHAADHQSLKQAVTSIEEQLTKIDQLFLLFKEERGYTKKAKYAKGRKLVIYRELITTSYKSLYVIRRLYAYEHDIIQLPDHFHMMIQERLDTLLTYHEHLHLKFIGKLKPEQLDWINDDHFIKRQEVMEIFMTQIYETKRQEDFSTYHLLHLLSAILTYEEHLEHLDTLISSYQTYHGDEIDVKVEI